MSSNTDLAFDSFVAISSLQLKVFVIILRVIDLVDLFRWFGVLTGFEALALGAGLCVDTVRILSIIGRM
jgi:hypothetical protein